MKKKYHTRVEIIDRIDRTKQIATKRSIEMEKCKAMADHLFRESAKESDPRKRGGLIVDAEHNRLRERKLTKQNSTFEKRLNALKRTLAAFDTEILPGQTDRSVVYQSA